MKEQLEAEYEHRKATDPTFRQTEEYLDYCFLMDGVPRSPFWEKWKVNSCPEPTKRQRPLFDRSTRGGAVPRRVKCVTTGEVFVSALVAAETKGINCETMRKALQRGVTMKNGTRWEYVVED